MCPPVRHVEEQSANAEMPRETPPTGRTRAVRFSSRTRIVLVRSLSEFSEEDLDILFRDNDEDEDTQQEIVRTIQMARSNNGNIPRHHQEIYTVRGIEHLCSQARCRRLRERKEQCVSAVLDEQDAQWDRDVAIADDVAIRNVALPHSRPAVEEAVTRAAQDATWVSRWARKGGGRCSSFTAIPSETSQRSLLSEGTKQRSLNRGYSSF